MKKLIITTVVALIISPVLAQGTLLLQGTVASVLSVTVTPETGHDTLDLTSTQTDLKVAEVLEQSNTAAGYKVFAKSDEGGFLNNPSGDSVAYTIGYGSTSSISLTATPQEVKNNSTGGVTSEVSDVDVAYVGKVASLLVEGTYSDTITFTIQSN